MRQRNRYMRRSERQPGGGVLVSAGSGSGSAGFLQVKKVDVASWTSDTGRYRYDLAHGQLRQGLIFQLVDTHTGEHFWPDQATSTDLNTVRIWLNTDPGANRVAIYYL